MTEDYIRDAFEYRVLRSMNPKKARKYLAKMTNDPYRYNLIQTQQAWTYFLDGWVACLEESDDQ